MELRPREKLNSLPTVITGVGDYLTRDGRRVTIHGMKDAPDDPDVTSFRAEGLVWQMFRGKVVPRDYTIWHVSGRKYPFVESRSDILSAWQD